MLPSHRLSRYGIVLLEKYGAVDVAQVLSDKYSKGCKPCYSFWTV